MTNVKVYISLQEVGAGGREEVGDGGEEERGGLREEMPCIPLSGQRENHRARGGEETTETRVKHRKRRRRRGGGERGRD